MASVHLSRVFHAVSSSFRVIVTVRASARRPFTSINRSCSDSAFRLSMSYPRFSADTSRGLFPQPLEQFTVHANHCQCLSNLRMNATNLLSVVLDQFGARRLCPESVASPAELIHGLYRDRIAHHSFVFLPLVLFSAIARLSFAAGPGGGSVKLDLHGA